MLSVGGQTLQLDYHGNISIYRVGGKMFMRRFTATYRGLGKKLDMNKSCG